MNTKYTWEGHSSPGCFWFAPSLQRRQTWSKESRLNQRDYIITLKLIRSWLELSNLLDYDYKSLTWWSPRNRLREAWASLKREIFEAFTFAKMIMMMMMIMVIMVMMVAIMTVYATTSFCRILSKCWEQESGNSCSLNDDLNDYNQPDMVVIMMMRWIMLDMFKQKDWKQVWKRRQWDVRKSLCNGSRWSRWRWWPLWSLCPCIRCTSPLS